MKKRYLITALALTVSVGFASVQGSYALSDKKQLLTAPSAYDFSIVSETSTEYLSHEWTYGTPSNRFPLDLTKTGGNTWSYTGFTWNNTIYSLENNYAVASIQLKIKTNDIYALAENVAVWGSNFMTGTYPTFEITINNYSKYPILFYSDISSNFADRAFNISSLDHSLNVSMSYVVASATTLSRFLIPPFSNYLIKNATTNFIYLDAMYFDVISPTSTFDDYEDSITDEAYNQGVVDTELNNVNWFNVIFIEGFGGVLSFIGNYEVLPGLKVFYIIGFTMVLAIVGFVAGQRKKD